MAAESPNTGAGQGGKSKDHQILIYLDGNERLIPKADWIVKDLKAELGVDPAKVLAKITPHGLEDLDDNASIKVHENEKFMEHARSGGSS